MQETRKNTYRINDRYMSKLQKDIILNILIIIMFYFVFNVMFRLNDGYEYIRIALIAIFALITVGVVYSDILRIQKFASIYYKVTSNYLEYFDGKKTVQYPWRGFQAVVINKNKVGLVYPYEFRTEEGNFYLHKRIGEMELLIPAILEKIRDHAEIDSEIPDIFQPADTLMDDIKRMI